MIYVIYLLLVNHDICTDIISDALNCGNTGVVSYSSEMLYTDGGNDIISISDLKGHISKCDKLEGAILYILYQLQSTTVLNIPIYLGYIR